MGYGRIGCEKAASNATAFLGDCGGFSGLAVPGAVRLHLADGVPLLRPEDQVFQAMLEGWRNQQLTRNLARSTVEGREATARAFADYVSAYPWAWSPRWWTSGWATCGRCGT